MGPSTKEPKGWPQNIRYLSSPSYSKDLSKETVATLKAKPVNETSVAASNGPSSNVSIRAINNSSHPAHGQFGLYASRHLPPDTMILFYIGIVHGRDGTDQSSDYDLSLDRELCVGVDAAKAGNEARFMNDYRGITDKGPNAEFREVWAEIGKGTYERRMGVFVLPAGKSGKRAAGIKKGEEILVSYGKGFWSERKADSSEQP